ncbi:unnamed protein product [Phytophthora lilii]|uniref:Unnamed protein product n=1 Tax=Phytophthora lilii TaxID=2077276 RepID=A0A9W7CPG8_9STRA|nr:unnamed protein product [Phytophthora lilii]
MSHFTTVPANFLSTRTSPLPFSPLRPVEPEFAGKCFGSFSYRNCKMCRSPCSTICIDLNTQAPPNSELEAADYWSGMLPGHWLTTQDTPVSSVGAIENGLLDLEWEFYYDRSEVLLHVRKSLRPCSRIVSL